MLVLLSVMWMIFVIAPNLHPYFRFFLRHAVQLLSPGSVVAKMNGRDNICKVYFSLVYHLTLKTLIGLR